jgi:hypothetical protein
MCRARTSRGAFCRRSALGRGVEGDGPDHRTADRAADLPARPTTAMRPAHGTPCRGFRSGPYSVENSQMVVVPGFARHHLTTLDGPVHCIRAVGGSRTGEQHGSRREIADGKDYRPHLAHSAAARRRYPASNDGRHLAAGSREPGAGHGTEAGRPYGSGEYSCRRAGCTRQAAVEFTERGGSGQPAVGFSAPGKRPARRQIHLTRKTVSRQPVERVRAMRAAMAKCWRPRS